MENLLEGRQFADLPDVLTAAETARILRVSREKLYQMLAANELPHKKLGGSYIIVKKQLMAWLEK